MYIKAQDVATVVKWHIDNGVPFDPDLLIHTVQDCKLDRPAPDESEEDFKRAEKLYAAVKELTEKHAKVIMSPSTFSPKLIYELIQALANTVGSEIMEPVMLLKLINEVPEIARRVLNIRPIAVKKLPASFVHRYYEQCINCYVYGLLDSSSAMARSVLEYSLFEVLEIKRLPYDISIKSKEKRDLLVILINTCKEFKLLTEELAKKADKVRLIGNKAIHRKGVTEDEVLLQISHLGDILEHIYA